VLAMTAHHALMGVVMVVAEAVLKRQEQAARAVKAAPQVAEEEAVEVERPKLVLGIQVPMAQLEFTHGR